MSANVSIETRLQIIRHLAANPGASADCVALGLYMSKGWIKAALYAYDDLFTSVSVAGVTQWFLTDPGRRVARARGYRLMNDDEVNYGKQ